MTPSTNEKAEKVMGRRRTDVVFFDYPCELGYRCPVHPQEWDEGLEWSEYEGFIWCPRCNLDYPSCFCLPTEDGYTRAIDVFLDIVADAKRRA